METLWIALGFIAGCLVSAGIGWILFQEMRINLRDLRESSQGWRRLYEATRREIDAIDPTEYTNAPHDRKPPPP